MPAPFALAAIVMAVGHTALVTSPHRISGVACADALFACAIRIGADLRPAPLIGYVVLVMRPLNPLLRPRHRRTRTPRAPSRLVLVSLLAGIPLAASTAQQSLYAETETSFEASAEVVPFAAAFADVVAKPLETEIDPLVPGDAVDLSMFEPPVEQSDVLRTLGTGVASFYGRRFHGRLTANGERFDMGAMTAAHKTLPFGSLVRVTNPRNGRSVTVRINDRGPFVRGRHIDLSRAAAQRIGMIGQGHARVELELLAR